MGDFGLVFVNYRCGDAIATRAGRFGDLGWPVIVVDNSGEYEGPGELVRPGENLGFGAACDLGISALPVEVRAACLHNPDLDIEPADLIALHARLRAQDRPGAIAPTLCTPAGVRPVGYRYPSLLRESLTTLRALRAGSGALPHATGEFAPSRTGGGAAVRPVAARLSPHAWGARFGSGALLMIDRDAYRAVGGFDHRYFVYVEDLDLWHRLRVMGWSVGFGSERAVHEQAAGSPTGRATRQILRVLGLQLFTELHEGPSWPTLRRLHRRLIRTDSAEAHALLRAVTDAWDAGLTPAQTLLELGPGLRSGSLFGSPEAVV